MKTCLRVLVTLLLPLNSGTHSLILAAGKTLAETLSPREQVLLKFNIDNSPSPEVFQEMWEKDSRAEATPELLGSYRTRFLNDLKENLATSDAHKPDASKKLEDQLTSFELDYAKSRAAQANKKGEFETLLGDSTLGPGVRALVLKDLKSYAANPGSPGDDAFGAWIGSYAKGTKPADAQKSLEAALKGEATNPPTEKPIVKEPPPCQGAYKDTYPNPVECAVIEALIGKPGTKITAESIKNIEETRAQITEWVGVYEANDEKVENLKPEALKTLAGTYKEKGIASNDRLKYYCNRKYPDGMGAPASAAPKGSKPGALDSVKKMKAEVDAAAGDASSENAKVGAGETADGTVSTQPTEMYNKCTNYFIQEKANRATTTQPIPTRPNIAGDVPDISADKKVDAPPEKKLPVKQMAIGAATGAIGFGIIGLLLGGPVGMLVAAAVGGAFMAGVSYINNL